MSAYEIYEKLLSEQKRTSCKVSKATGIATSTLTKSKQGEYIPKRDKLQKIADYLGVRLEFLTGKSPYRTNEDFINSFKTVTSRNIIQTRIFVLCRYISSARLWKTGKNTDMGETQSTYEKEHSLLVRRLAPGGMLLLKRDSRFPLEAPGEIALFGSGARHTVFGGSGSGEVNARRCISIEEGLKEAGFTVTTDGWLQAYDEVRERAIKDFRRKIIREALAAGQNPVVYGMGAVMPEPEYDIPLTGPGMSGKCDTALYVLARISGEGSDRRDIPGDFRLTGTEMRDIRKLNRLYPKFMLVLNTGGPVDLSEVTDVKNIFLLSQPGAQAGEIFSDLLLGKAYPSGKLTASWCAAKDLSGPGTFGDPDDTYYREGIYVGYRYFDTAGVRPLFPFGFGLGWTDFETEVEDVWLSETAELSGGKDRKALQNVSVRVRVRNTGAFPGREVVQAYLSFPQGQLDQPFQVLAAFAKTGELAPGEEQELTLTAAPALLASFDKRRLAYVLERGRYILRIGTDSRNTQQAAALNLQETVIVRKTAVKTGEPGFSDWHPVQKETAGTWETGHRAPRFRELTLNPEELVFPAETEESKEDPRTQKQLKELDDADLARLNMGRFDDKGGILSVIGNASRKVAGAAGETADFLESQGVPGLVMADGPAGLRLSRDWYRDRRGAARAVSDGLPESATWLLPGVLRRILKRLTGGKAPEGAEIRHQYCTPIPAGTCVAQSFDIKLSETLGRMVAEEMKRFGVDLWLAPALNIQRSVFCGRNYEYFSEDPLLSGRMAAALVRGVQQGGGCGAVIKHFTANNQETGRYTANSHVSERGLREIYLRSFAVCIRESHPAALMTSYNLVNGVHTSENRELLEGILRGEFGFNGVVMTDWLVPGMKRRGAKYPVPDPARVAASGNDLYMPGSAGDYKRLLRGLSRGSVSRGELERNAARVLKMVRRLKD